MALHFGATGTRTLCGRPYTDRQQLAMLWVDFLQAYRTDPSGCCAACLRACKGWQRFSRDLAAANAERRRQQAREG